MKCTWGEFYQDGWCLVGVTRLGQRQHGLQDSASLIQQMSYGQTDTSQQHTPRYAQVSHIQQRPV